MLYYIHVKKIILIAFMLLFPAIAFAQPSIVFDMEQHDFGTIEKAGVLEFSFEFRNEGTEDLEINKLIPS
jgi:hypothetical protein